MKEYPQLDNRLALCASFVRNGARLADIGTDHAYLPAALALKGSITSAVASDVRKGPLENAESNILRFGVQDIVRTVLSDGLDGISPEEADDIVIAGMGGELIIKIIDRAEWLRSNDKHLILQPMTRAEELRPYLLGSGFDIVNEKACIQGRKCYSVMLCVYDGVIRDCPQSTAYIGSLGTEDSPEAAAYIRSVKNKLMRKIRGLLTSGNTEEAALYKNILDSINEN